MSEIINVFHGTKVVRDLLDTGTWYHDFFNSQVYEAQYLEWEDSRNSANIMGGTFSMEILCPKAGSTAPSARFLERHGNHFLNIAFWVQDGRAMAKRITDKGVRVALPGGRLVQELPDEEFRYFIPHPKDAYGTMFEFIEDDKGFHDPRRKPWWGGEYWKSHPLGIEGLSHCTVAVADLDGASRFYTDVIGAPQVHEEENAEAKTRSRFFAMGDTLMELAAPTAPDSDLGRHMEVHGPIVYGFTFKVRDLDSARAHAQRSGLTQIDRGSQTFELDPAQAHGAVYGFTERKLPGHPVFA